MGEVPLQVFSCFLDFWLPSPKKEKGKETGPGNGFPNFGFPLSFPFLTEAPFLPGTDRKGKENKTGPPLSKASKETR